MITATALIFTLCLLCAVFAVASEIVLAALKLVFYIAFFPIIVLFKLIF